MKKLFLIITVVFISLNSSAQCWKSIATRAFHSVGIQDDGSLWAWGLNSDGQLGDGTTDNRLIPKRIGTDNDWAYVAAGTNATYAIKQNGTLWAWGSNSEGQLSDGTTTSRLLPYQVLPGTTWSRVSAGDSFMVAQKSDGTLWSCGDNFLNQLGHPVLGTSNCTLNLINTDTDWMDFNCGNRHTVLIKTNHTIWGFGDGVLGKLATGSNNGYDTPTQLLTENNWAQITADVWTTHFRKTDGSIYAVGQNQSGALGFGTNYLYNLTVQQIGTDTDWRSIEACTAHTIAIKNNGTLWSCGINTSGELGNGTTTNTNVLAQVGTAVNWTKARCGWYYTLTLDSNGTLWAWGDNTYGQLGDGTTTNRLVPTQIGYICTLSVPQFEKAGMQLLTNPVEDIAQLSFDRDGQKKIEIFNSLGALLDTKTVSGDFISFDVSGYATGVYFVKCTMENNIIKTLKMVKK